MTPVDKNGNISGLFEAEQRFLSTFVKKEKQKRYLELWRSKNPSIRRKFLCTLSHALESDLEERRSVRISSKGIHPDFATVLRNFLLQQGSLKSIFITTYDGVYLKKSKQVFEERCLPLEDALEKYVFVYGYYYECILHCRPGNLAVYVSEMQMHLCSTALEKKGFILPDELR